jgi:hypothetical protein
MPDQGGSQRGGDQRSGAKAGYREARDEASPIGKPLHQRRDGDDVAQTQSKTTQHPIRDVQNPDAPGRQTRQRHAETVTNASRDPDGPRAHPTHPETPQECGET